MPILPDPVGWLSGPCDKPQVRIDWAPDDGFGAPPVLLAVVDEVTVASAAKVRGASDDWIVLPNFRTNLSGKSRGHELVGSEDEARRWLREFVEAEQS